MKPILFLFIIGLISCGEPVSYGGKIVDYETGQPVPGATVVLRRSGQNIGQVTADSAGKFRFLSIGLEDSIIFSAKGYRNTFDVFDYFMATRPRPVTIWMKCKCQHDEKSTVQN